MNKEERLLLSDSTYALIQNMINTSIQNMINDMIKEGKITSSLSVSRIPANIVSNLEKERTIESPQSVPASSSSLVQQTPEKDQLSRMLIIFSALDNEDRLRIIFTIFNEPDISFNDIAKKTGIDKSALAYHLGVLKRAGLVEMEYQKRGKKLTKYRITDEGKKILENVLTVLKELANLSIKP